MRTDPAGLKDFLEVLAYPEQPLGMFYSDDEPEEGFSPKPLELPTAEKEAQNQVEWQKVWDNFSCVIGHIWLARKKKTTAYFSRERFGCLGGAFFLGFNKPQLEAIVHYVSSGIPGVMEGEHYLDSPQTTRKFYEDLDPAPAPAKYCIFKPLDQFQTGETPELVIFFARPEVISGLHQLATYVTNDVEAVMSPWGAGCTDIVTWPLKYLSQGRLRAVVGGWDPSCRKYLKTDEISFSTPKEMFDLMLGRWRESFLVKGTWALVQKKAARSRRAWGEEQA